MRAIDVVLTAREYLGTPWVHTARLKKIGIDCIGLVIETYNEYGANIPPNTDYSLEDEYNKLEDRLSLYFEPLNTHNFQAGDILVFRTKMMYNHVAIFSGEGTMIHSYQGSAHMQVIEEEYSAKWAFRFVRAFRHKDIEI